MATTLPLHPVAPARPVDPEWKCCRSGDCCTKPAEVVMTKQEAELLVHHAPPTVSLKFRPIGDDADLFVALKAQPCPLYIFGSCIVYDVRPFNCRRYNCLRPDVKAEPFDPSGANLMERVEQSRVARRMAERFQRKAQGWAQKMGWPMRNDYEEANRG